MKKASKYSGEETRRSKWISQSTVEVWFGYTAHLSHFRRGKFFSMCAHLSLFLSWFLCNLMLKIISLHLFFTLNLIPSITTAGSPVSHAQKQKLMHTHAHTNTSRRWHKPDRAIMVNTSRRSCVSSPLIGSNKTSPHWVCPHHSKHKAVGTFPLSPSSCLQI